MRWHYGYRPYVSAAQRQVQAANEIAKRTKKGEVLSPVRIEGRTIASTFWGKAWCRNLESYSDFSNRLPRGRSYVCNGSVVDLKIEKGRIRALVRGSALYEIEIDITALPTRNWQSIKERCAGKIGTLVELLQGKLSSAVMEMVTDREEGLFPKPHAIKMRCSCPDYAGMCKHIAATMFGIGNRLDTSPELLFVLRGVDHLELIEQAIPKSPVKSNGVAPKIAMDDLGAIFDIEMGEAPVADPVPPKRNKRTAKQVAKKAVNGKKASTTKKKKTSLLPRKG